MNIDEVEHRLRAVVAAVTTPTWCEQTPDAQTALEYVTSLATPVMNDSPKGLLYVLGGLSAEIAARYQAHAIAVGGHEVVAARLAVDATAADEPMGDALTLVVAHLNGDDIGVITTINALEAATDENAAGPDAAAHAVDHVVHIFWALTRVLHMAANDHHHGAPA